jgi:chromosome segregation ATPase
VVGALEPLEAAMNIVDPTSLELLQTTGAALEEYAATLARVSRLLPEQRQSLKELERRLADRSTELRQSVYLEQDERTGKPRFSNEGARDAATTLLMRDDLDAVSLRKHIESTQRRIAELQADSDEASTKRQNLLAPLNYAASWNHFNAPMPVYEHGRRIA